MLKSIYSLTLSTKLSSFPSLSIPTTSIFKSISNNSIKYFKRKYITSSLLKTKYNGLYGQSRLFSKYKSKSYLSSDLLNIPKYMLMDINLYTLDRKFLFKSIHVAMFIWGIWNTFLLYDYYCNGRGYSGIFPGTCLIIALFISWSLNHFSKFNITQMRLLKGGTHIQILCNAFSFPKIIPIKDITRLDHIPSRASILRFVIKGDRNQNGYIVDKLGVVHDQEAFDYVFPKKL